MPLTPPPLSLRIIRKVPELVESFIDRAAALLNDRNHNVILAGASLMLQVWMA